MRDPNRIENMLKKLEGLWKANPDYRLGQLILNIIKIQNNNAICPEVFYLEDDRMEEAMDKWIGWINQSLKDED